MCAHIKATIKFSRWFKVFALFLVRFFFNVFIFMIKYRKRSFTFAMTWWNESVWLKSCRVLSTQSYIFTSNKIQKLYGWWLSNDTPYSKKLKREKKKIKKFNSSYLVASTNPVRLLLLFLFCSIAKRTMIFAIVCCVYCSLPKISKSSMCWHEMDLCGKSKRVALFFFHRHIRITIRMKLNYCTNELIWCVK